MSYAPVPTTGTAPLNLPLYGASIGQAVQRFFKKYATFSGRASRSEFWWWALVYFIIAAVLNGVTFTTIDMQGLMRGDTSDLGPSYWISVIIGLALLVPNLAVIWRRLHDTNKSGGFFFLWLIPIVGPLIVLILCIFGPDPQGQRFDR